MRQLNFLSFILLVVLGCCKEPQQPKTTNQVEMLWKIPLSSGEETGSTNPILYKDFIVYAANDNGDINKSKLIALNKATGEKVWQWKNIHQNVGYVPRIHTYQKDNILIVPILGRIYQIAAINLDNGQEIWHYTLPEGGSWRITGIDNFIFQIRGNFDRMKEEIFVADIRTGVWKSIYTASNVNAPIYIQGMHTYRNLSNTKYLAFLVAKYKDFSFTETESTIYKYDIDSSKVVSQRKLDFLKKNANPVLEIVDSYRFWLKNEPVYSLLESTLEKELDIQIPLISNVSGNIAVSNNKLFMPTIDKLFCFNATTGQQLWQEDSNTSGSPSRILAYNDVVYYTSNGDGRFHAIDATNGKTIADIASPDKKPNGQGGFDGVVTLDTINKRIYTATYFSAICYKMPK
ncbi:MAG: PQQ-binding-like beta-propeller repeat protein [Saprospiraceae bacterium]|nr:PQQ-binding-like beta-propeller repeat protein [Saprospiraceae bacterium]